MWFIGFVVFFLVFKVILDIIYWYLFMLFVGIVSFINSELDLCVNERIM